MNKRRLLKLADLLEADARNKKGIKFDMASWGNVSNPAKPLSCGTSACAMGLAALSGAFKRQGLESRIVNYGIEFKWKGRAEWGGFKVARLLFDISLDTAVRLFGTTAERGAGASGERAKAKQIRKLVATGAI